VNIREMSVKGLLAKAKTNIREVDEKNLESTKLAIRNCALAGGTELRIGVSESVKIFLTEQRFRLNIHDSVWADWSEKQKSINQPLYNIIFDTDVNNAGDFYREMREIVKTFNDNLVIDTIDKGSISGQKFFLHRGKISDKMLDELKTEGFIITKEGRPDVYTIEIPM